MNKQSVVKDSFLYTGSYILLLLLTIFIPGAEIVTFFIMPIPFILYVVKHDWKVVSVASMILIFITLWLATAVTMPLTIFAVVTGLMLGLAIRNDYRAYETWAQGTVGAVVGIVAIYLFVEGVLGVSIRDAYERTVNESLTMTRDMFESFGLNQLGAEDFELLQDQMMGILNILPVIIVVFAMTIAFLSQWITYKILNKQREEKLTFPPFRTYNLPKIILWIYFFTIIISWINAEDTSSYLYLATINISHLAGVLLILQGLSFIFHYVHVKEKSLALPIISIVFLVLFPIGGIYFMRILGIIDLGFALKKIVQK